MSKTGWMIVGVAGALVIAGVAIWMTRRPTMALGSIPGGVSGGGANAVTQVNAGGDIGANLGSAFGRLLGMGIEEATRSPDATAEAQAAAAG